MEQDHREKRKDGAGPQTKEKRWSRTTDKREKMKQDRR
jgi:hypothetical protein